MAPGSDAKQPHVVIFPFMAQGHTLPLIDLSKALSISLNVKVTIVTTPSNAESILIHVSKHPNISIAELPFPNAAVSGLPAGCENTSQLPSLQLHPSFVLATKHLRNPFEDLLRAMRDSQTLPLCVISDFFLGFTLEVCKSFRVPRLVFHGMGVLSMAIAKVAWVQYQPLVGHDHHDDDPVDLPGLKLPFALTVSDLPLEVINSSDVENPMTRLLEELVEAGVNSWGVVANTFEEIEMGQVSFFESFYTGGARAWCVGPLNLCGGGDDFGPSDDEVMRWLDGKGSGTVVYVSFGSQSDVSDAQLDEVAYGLAESGEGFVWVVRSKTWTAPKDVKDRLNDKGMLVLSWVNQRRILSHSAVGGFLSHCGWNSVLESLSVGIPILAWPLFADQGLNSKLVVEALGAGIRVRKRPEGSRSGLVPRGAVCKGVRDLMGPDERGQAVRERAKALSGLARRAIEKGGSSWKTLNELIEKLQGCVGLED